MRDFKTLFMALLLIVAGAWLLMLAGCSGEQLNGWPATAEFERLVNGSARFSKHDTGVAGLYIVVDHETGIEYAAYRNKAFTPLLDEEGRPLRVREPTEGNAKRALLQLASLARMRPDGIWDGD